MMFYKENNFKEEPLIGKIPADWESVKLEEVVEIHDSKRIPLSEMERKNRKGQYPYCGANGIIDYIDDYIFDGEFVLLAEDGGSYGRLENTAYIMNGKFWVNNHAHVLQAIEGKTSNLFLKYALDFLDLNPYVVGSTRKKLNQEQMREIKIPFPPLEEQRAIVGVLGVVDSAIGLVDRVILKTERLKKGLMQTLLTRGIGHKEYKQTPIGTIPKTWQIKSLSNVFKLASGKPRPSEISEKATQETPYPVYGGNGVLGYANEFLLDQETIVIGRVGEYCGSVYKTTKFSWITDNALYATEISKDFDLEFLKYLLSFLNLNRFKKKMGQPLLTQTIIYSIDIPQPPLSEQKEIANVLLVVDRKLEIEKNEKARLKCIKQGLMDLLLTGKIRVKVD